MMKRRGYITWDRKRAPQKAAMQEDVGMAILAKEANKHIDERFRLEKTLLSQFVISEVKTASWRARWMSPTTTSTVVPCGCCYVLSKTLGRFFYSTTKPLHIG